MSKTITSSQLLGEIGETAVRLRFLNIGFQFDGRSRLEAGVDGIAEVMDKGKPLGACLNSRCSIVSESDSSLGYEQVFSPLEYRSNAAAAAACAGFRAERPCLAVYR